MQDNKFIAQRLRDFLSTNGIRPSHHRIKVLEYMMSHQNHPTAETIYEVLSTEIPTLSKTTVYNTLKLFLQKKIVTGLRLPSDESETRFDYNTEFHAHFKCLECGNVYDIDIPCPIKGEETIEGHIITNKFLYFSGICRNCNKAKR